MTGEAANDGGQDDILKTASQWLDEGRKLALATVVETWGSSPRPIGSQLLIDQDSNMVGSVTAGCIEAAVVNEAQSIMADGKPKLLTYGVTDEMAWDLGLACGGSIKVFLETID